MNRKLLASLALVALTGGSAFAADLRVKAPPMVAPAPVYSWTGCYIGANIGGARSEASVTFFGVEDFSRSQSGGAFGGQVGCDYQFASNWVIGIQGMIDGTNVEADRLSNRFANTNFHAEVDRFATITARFGYAVSPAFLIYGKVGWGSIKTSLTATHTLTNAELGSASRSLSGLDLGVGGEWMFAPNWSMFIEWDRIRPEEKTVFFRNLGGGTTATVEREFDKFLVGVNWRFSGARGF